MFFFDSVWQINGFVRIPDSKGVDFSMAVNISNVAQAGLLSQQYPPPLLPKPGKENVRLQKILKKTAKKKAASQASQTPVPFRSSLSPVNEASPDLEHSDHSTPPKTPETPIYGGTLHPRFNVRPLYQHSPSPYPHQQSIAYTKPTRFSPQPYVTPGFTAPPHVAPFFSYTTPPHPVPSYAATSVTVTTITTTTEIIRPVDSQPGAAVSAAVQHKNNIVLVTNSSLTPTFITSKAPSPQPTALDDIKPSKPMFDVPQITNYTAKTAGLRTSYYASSPTLERSKTPISEVKRGPTPTFEVRRIVTPTSELKRDKTPTREIRRGTTPTSEIKRDATPTFEIKRGPTPTSEIRRGATPTSEIKQGTTPTSEIKRGTTPTSEIKRGTTPTSEIQRGTTSTSEIKRGTTPTSEIQRGTTSTSEIKRGMTPTSEIQRGTTPTSEIKRGTTPTSEIQRGTTPTSEVKRGTTPTSEIKRGTTPTSEIKRGTTLEVTGTTPASDIKGDTTGINETRRGRTPTRDRTPTLEFLPSKTLSGRPKTPSHHVSPARTPIIVISRANPLLFAVSPVHMEGRRSKTPTSSLLGPSDEIAKDIQNGEVHMKPSELSVDIVSSEILTQDALKSTEISESQSPKVPIHEGPKPVAPAAQYQSPETSNHEVFKPTVSSPGLQRPRVPPFAGQRPRTPTSKSQSTYYGLTPSEYVAHGGIQSYTPAFGISRSLSPSTVESKAAEQESQMTTQIAQSKGKEQSTFKEAASPNALPKETEALKALVGKAPPSTNAAFDKGTPLAPSSDVSKPSPPTETILKPTQKAPTSEVKVPVVTIPTIVVSKADTPPSDPPKAVITVPVTRRVRTPTYGPPKPKTPPPDSVVETTKPETKPAPPSAKATTPDQNADMAKISKPTPAEAAVTTKANKVLKKPSVPQKSLLERIKEQKTLVTTASEKAATEQTEDKPLVKPTDDQKDKVKPEKAEAKESIQQETKPVVEEKVGDSSFPTAEPLLKAFQKPKGMKSKLSGWSRLKKHMVVEVEEPRFPEAELEPKTDGPDDTAQKPSEQKTQSQEADKISEKSQSQEGKEGPRSLKMWDAVLFQMFSTKENIMQQIEASKTEEQKKEEAKLNKPQEIPSFAHRLPVLLYSPRFNARKLREAASRPVTKISTVFEMGLIGRKAKDEEPKDFNRTAKGFTSTKE
ncbi:hypothetical protein NFI96_003089 [Prochilodus magdalenae]|nr:hypothetical protein NFI96_003089 [Prochilodus magdalenae]